MGMRTGSASNDGDEQGGVPSARLPQSRAVASVATYDKVPFTHDPYRASADRYKHFEYRRVGTSGLMLPPLSLGLWYNFGDDRPFATQRDILRFAFDQGITHFDLANNYGPPYGAAEENFGRVMRQDFRPYRDELIVSSKAGWDMWPGPYGQLGSRKYLLASLDASLHRLGLDYVDIFYSHRFDPQTPLEETVGALDSAVRSGKCRYVGISSYSAERTREAVAIARRLGTPLVIHQPSYSLLNRWIERDLLGVLDDRGMGAIAFTALAQGLLTNKYLEGPSEVHRATARPTFDNSVLTDETLSRLRALNAIAQRRGQTLAQLALVWVLRDRRVASALVGASTVQQLRENLAALEHQNFTREELAEVDRYAVDSGVDLWRASSDL